MNQYLRIGVMAIPLAALLFIIHGSRYSGLGTNIISAGFAGQTIYSYDWLLKLLFTIFTTGNRISGWRSYTTVFDWNISWSDPWRSTWITTNVMCSTRICSSLWKRNKYTDRTDHDWIRSVWRS